MRSRFRKRPSAHPSGHDELADRFFGEHEKRADSPTADRKLKQLCREVYRVLVQVWPGEPHDHVLDAVCVVDVRPAPDASRLAIQLSVPAGVDAKDVIDRLQKRKGHLRSEIASAIQRKRTPELTFEVAP